MSPYNHMIQVMQEYERILLFHHIHDPPLNQSKIKLRKVQVMLMYSPPQVWLICIGSRPDGTAAA